ncbi:hypothetical protein [Campylobacter sp. RM16187]|uniref:hypothetical protein n=1 Tax=Campylobacter sp. RM16187 TaxID=1660063 RepID=UPI0021B50545|nr:hypothetical protein [Campylobacter sp. RM16187]QKG30009.1 hypothetical protein CDOMF_1780 [Campylobacter sp. RM16187]
MKITTSGLQAIKADYAEYAIQLNDRSDEVSEQKLYEIGYLAYYSYRQTKGDCERISQGLGMYRVKAETAEKRAEALQEDNIRLYQLIGRETDKNKQLQDKLDNLQSALLLFREGDINQDELIETLLIESED